jgi:hypothetical protein
MNKKCVLLGVDGEHLGHVNHYFHTHWIQEGKFKGNWNMEKKTSTHGPCFCSLGYIYATLRLFLFLFSFIM